MLQKYILSEMLANIALNILNPESNIKNLCRTCLADTSSINSIFITEQYKLKEYKNIVEMFEFSTSLQLSFDESLPPQICLSCAEKLEKACLFKKQCLDSQDNLLGIITQLNIKNKNNRDLHCCTECNKIFLSLDDVKHHASSEHKAQSNIAQCLLTTKSQRIGVQAICGYCERNFDSRSSLEEHVIEHIEIKADLKQVCKTERNNKILLKRSKLYESDQEFADAAKECVHESSSEDTTKEKYTCLSCCKEFASKIYLTKHMERHEQQKPAKFHSKPLICEHCSQGFCKASSLAVHIRTKHTKERIFKCDKCDKCYAVKRDLNRHLKTHTDTYRCPICDKVFGFRQTLKQHVRAHERNGPVSCKQCDQNFKDDILLERHMKTTHSGEVHKCLNCEKVFTHSTKLRIHMKSHNSASERRLLCNFCPKRFNFVHHLKNHERTHTGAKPFLCSKCGRGFSQSHCLTLHMRQHDDVQPYPCTYCNKSFGQLQRLQRHMRMHTGEKAFMCNICGKRFCANITLTRHMETHKNNENIKAQNKHPNSSPNKLMLVRKKNLVKQELSCIVCNKAFVDINSLTLHMRDHARVYSCKVCNEKFALTSAVKNHMKIHSSNSRQYHCEICNKTFSRPEHLKFHTKRAHSNERPHNCNICNRSFCRSGELTIHMRSHTGEKPYICTYCKKGFSTSSSLKIHIRSHTGERPYICGICSKAFATSSTLLSHINTHTGKAVITESQKENSGPECLGNEEDDMTGKTTGSTLEKLSVITINNQEKDETPINHIVQDKPNEVDITTNFSNLFTSNPV